MINGSGMRGSKSQPAMKGRQPIRLVGVPCIQLGLSPREEHAGWNFVDQVDLEPKGECRYVVDFVREQAVSISAAGSHPVALIVIDEDEYENRQGSRASSKATSNGSCDIGPCRVTFRAARTGAYDVIVTNLADKRARVLVRVIATPVR